MNKRESLTVLIFSKSLKMDDKEFLRNYDRECEQMDEEIGQFEAERSKLNKFFCHFKDIFFNLSSF